MHFRSRAELTVQAGTLERDVSEPLIRGTGGQGNWWGIQGADGLVARLSACLRGDPGGGAQACRCRSDYRSRRRRVKRQALASESSDSGGAADMHPGALSVSPCICIWLEILRFVMSVSNYH